MAIVYTQRSESSQTMMTLLLMLSALAATSMALDRQSIPSMEYVSGQYLLTLDPSMTGSNIRDLSHVIKEELKVKVLRSYNLKTAKFLLIAGEYDDVLETLRLPLVLDITHDVILSTTQESCSVGSAAGCWGLDRTDQREALSYTDPLSEDAVYTWGRYEGVASVVYVTDTGIDIEHPEFEGRAAWGYTAGSIPNDDDVHGHGTHCAGTIGSKSYGIAKSVSLVAVKVFNDFGVGSTSDIIEGLEWIQMEHDARSGEDVAKSIISMSIGGGINDPLDAAVEACVDDGIVVVVAAGNGNDDACSFSPSRVPKAITVSATDILDENSESSNWGRCVNIFAPGEEVLSTTPGDTTSVYSGTSMAVPHVVGVIARFQDSLNITPTPAFVST